MGWGDRRIVYFMLVDALGNMAFQVSHTSSELYPLASCISPIFRTETPLSIASTTTGVWPKQSPARLRWGVDLRSLFFDRYEGSVPDSEARLDGIVPEPAARSPGISESLAFELRIWSTDLRDLILSHCGSYSQHKGAARFDGVPLPRSFVVSIDQSTVAARVQRY